MLVRNWISLLILAGVLLGLAPGAHAQSRDVEKLRPGRLLVAGHDTQDPNFAESVILIVDYTEDGAFGLIINRQTNLSVSKGMPQLRGADGHSGLIYLGGPVGRNNAMALMKDHEEPHPNKHVFGEVYLISRKAELEAVLSAGAGDSDLRLYVGYSGWGPGQLDHEVERGDWYIFDAKEDIVFDGEPETLWSRLIAQTEMRTAQVFK